jgi:6-pyruvoyltetrahydropterin/6-carboxytetrahydropterin synthase
VITITKIVKFCASHRYWRPEWSEERNRQAFGQCANEFGHGHNYVLEVTLQGPVDAETGMIVDLKQVKRVLEGRILEKLDHQYLNEAVPHFLTHVPTTENLVLYLKDLLADAFSGIRLHRIRLWESEDLCATWEEDRPC